MRAVFVEALLHPRCHCDRRVRAGPALTHFDGGVTHLRVAPSMRMQLVRRGTGNGCVAQRSRLQTRAAAEFWFEPGPQWLGASGRRGATERFAWRVMERERVDFLHQVEPQMEREPEMEQEPLMDRGRVISFTRCWRLFSRAGSRGRWVTQIWQPGRWYGQRATMDPRFAGEFVTYSAQTCGTEIWRPLLRAGQWYHQVWQPGRWHCPPGTFAYAAEGELVIYLTPQWRLLWRAGRWESQLERYGQRWESQHSQDAGGSPPAGGERLEIGMRERLEAAMRCMRSRELENGIVSHCLVCNGTPSRSMMCPRCDRIFRDLVKWAASLVPTSFPPSWQRSTRSCVSDDSGASVILLCPVCSTDLPAEAADAWTSSSPYINSFCPICKESLLHTVRWARFGYDCWL